MKRSHNETRYIAKYSAATGEYHAVAVHWKESIAIGVVTTPAGWYDDYARIFHGKTYASEYGAIRAARRLRGGK